MKAIWVQLKLLADIIWTFGKISPMTFGGGYAMLPLMEKVIVEQREWLTESEMTDAISISGSAPGGIGVNASAYIGYRLAGIQGAIAAVLGITIPTFIIIILAGITLMHFRDVPKVEAALKGIHAAIIALIAYAAYRMIKRAVYDSATIVIWIVTAAVLLTTSIHPVYVIVGGIVAGVSIMSFKKLRGVPLRLEKEAEEHPDTKTAQPSFKYSDYYIAEGI
jgi:chromate transporter